MKRVLLVALVLAASVSLVTSILRGESVSIHSHPHLVVVQYSANDQVKRCGGSIISQNWILTSADCMFDITRTIHSPGNVKVIRGYKRSNDLEFIPVHKFNVSEIIPHNQFTWSNYANRYKYNLGLVRLETSINFASGLNMVKLAVSEDQYSSSECVVAGWNEPSYELHQVTVALQWGQTEMFSSRVVTTETDVGYPVLCPTSSGNKIQVAVVAVNIENYSMYASVPLSYKWIQQYLSMVVQPTSLKPWRPWETSENRPSGSAKGPSRHQHSGSRQRPPSPVRPGSPSGSVNNPLGHQHSGPHQRPPSLVRPGSPAVNGTHLVIVSIVRNGRRKQCGGSIITENYVLTAASCMFNTSVIRKPKEVYLPSEVTVYSEYEKNSFGQFQPMYESKASKLIPHRFYSKMVQASAATKCDIGLIRLETPINFTRFSNLAPVLIPSSPDQYEMNGCVMEHFNKSYHPSQTPVTLNESESNLFISSTKFDKEDKGNPVFCPGISSPPYQVAVVVAVGRGTKHPSKFSKVSFYYKWIQQQDHVFHSHLVTVIFKRENEEKRCSGSVIHLRYVLTAAHCFYSSSGEMFNTSNATVFGGFHLNSSHRDFGATTIKKAHKFILPKNYQNDSPERAKYDIGLVMFGNRTRVENYMISVKLAKSVEKLDISQCWWAGWPDVSKRQIVNHQTSLELSVANSPQIFTSRPVFGVNNIDHNQGGPVLCPSKSNPEELEQVAVAIETNPNGYRYIAVSSYLSWIQSKNVTGI